MSSGIELEYYNHHPRVIDDTTTNMFGEDHENVEDHLREPPASFTETDLTLLCLDYLRDLRRSFPSDVLEEQEGSSENKLNEMNKTSHAQNHSTFAACLLVWISDTI